MGVLCFHLINLAILDRILGRSRSWEEKVQAAAVHFVLVLSLCGRRLDVGVQKREVREP